MFGKKPLPQEDSLRHEMEMAKRELDAAYSRFENVIDPDLITSCIYQINSVWERYRYLVKQWKAAGPNK